MKTVAGIDVSKLTLDVYFQGKTRRFSNDVKGFVQIGKWCSKADLIVMEATGSYHVDLAYALCTAGLSVAVVNPARAHYFAKFQGKRNKTDKVDAKSLSEFGASHELARFVPPTAQQVEMVHLVRLRADLVDSRARLKNRLQTPQMTEFESSILSEEFAANKILIKKVEQRIEALVEASQELTELMQLLTSITGVGKITAWVLIAEIRDIKGFDNAKKLAAFVGVCPTLRHSGTSLNGSGQLSRQGNKEVRKATYMAALAAIRQKGIFQDFFLRLVQKGKNRKAALAAVMHKLIRVVYGVIKSRSPFNTERTLTTQN